MNKNLGYGRKKLRELLVIRVTELSTLNVKLNLPLSACESHSASPGSVLATQIYFHWVTWHRSPCQFCTSEVPPVLYPFHPTTNKQSWNLTPIQQS